MIEQDTTEQETKSYVIRWEGPGEHHPVIAELQARPGDWGVIQENVTPSPFMGYSYNEAVYACNGHPRIECEKCGSSVYAKWMTDEEYDAHLVEDLAKQMAKDDEEGAAA